ncbi:MAG: K(+)-transporting ATPase subunit F [Oscillatoriales cyanobacterium]|nr:MAG: K(+)-transporting ATPase subunit F [Oscillatoriales cyanobacterium]
MNPFNPIHFLPFQVEAIQAIGIQLYRRKVPRYLFCLLCFNLIPALAVQAATGDVFSRSQAYALGILGLVTVALSGYLFVVMFQPERF